MNSHHGRGHRLGMTQTAIFNSNCGSWFKVTTILEVEFVQSFGFFDGQSRISWYLFFPTPYPVNFHLGFVTERSGTAGSSDPKIPVDCTHFSIIPARLRRVTE